MSRLLYLSLVIVTLFALINANVFAREESHDYYIEKNIAYSNNTKLDVYYDKNDLYNGKPVIIYIHGGYWCEGDKDEELKIGTFLQRKGYITVIPNYRLYPETSSIDDMVEDINLIINWTINNIEMYGGDKDKMSLVGFNAGAHLASLALLKATLNMEVNGKKTSTLVTFKHMILLNSPYSFPKDERLEFEINSMRNNAKLSPSLKYLEKYADAKATLFLGKSSLIFDEVDILNKQDDQSINSLGAEKVTFVECDNDTNTPIGSSTEMMEEIQRVVDDVEIVKQVYQGDYDYIIKGVKNDDEEISKIFYNLINSAYESH